jgi:hypothetical protein
MALYHLSARTGTRATGASALAKAQYIQREGRYARVPDAVVYTASGNLPSFAQGQASAYWDAADLYERSNGRLFKEVEFALPLELGSAEQRQLADAFAQELQAGERLPYTLAIHAGHGRNPHCHVLLSERVNDGVARPASQWFRRWNERSPDAGGARKSRALHPRAWLERVRERWAALVNRALERAGVRERVDHRSLAAQGLAREPQIHLGPNVARMAKRGIDTERADRAASITARAQGLATRLSALQSDPAAAVQERLPRPSTGTPAAPESERGSASNEHARSADGGAAATASKTSALDGAGEIDCERSDAGASAPASAASPSVLRPDPEIGRAEAAHSPGQEAEPTGPRSSRQAPGRETASRDESRSPEAATERRPADRTERAVTRQLRAMDCTLYEIGIRDAASGRMMNRTWTAEQVLEQLPQLKALNARGNDIFVRPAAQSPGHGLVLVDDLSRTTLAALDRDGRGPAVIVETSPRNYQAWIRLPGQASDAQRTEVARRLAREYAGDPASADAQHYGRLAGFTNRKRAYRSAEGLQPFALLRRARGLEAPGGAALLREAARALEERALGRSTLVPAGAPVLRPHSPETERAATAEFRRHLEQLRRQVSDISRCDFSAAIRLAAAGYEPETIRQAVRAASPNLEERKHGQAEDYVRRTVDAAVEAQARRLEQERSRERDTDLER